MEGDHRMAQVHWRRLNPWCSSSGLARATLIGMSLAGQACSVDAAARILSIEAGTQVPELIRVAGTPALDSSLDGFDRLVGLCDDNPTRVLEYRVPATGIAARVATLVGFRDHEARIVVCIGKEDRVTKVLELSQ